jgi:hypothetical protein
MNTPGMTKPTKASSLQDFAVLLRRLGHAAWLHMRGRRALILLGAAVVGAGLAFNWNLLTAMGRIIRESVWTLGTRK